MAIHLKAIYRFKAMPIKIPVSFVTEIEKSILKFTWKYNRPQILKAILTKKCNVAGITISDFKLYHIVIVTKTS
jgi:hypothetical protein